MSSGIRLPLISEALFLHSLYFFGNLQRKGLIQVPSQEKGKPRVKIVENLTFMLAKH